MRRLIMYAPIMSGHEFQWLDTLIELVRKEDLEISLYTTQSHKFLESQLHSESSILQIVSIDEVTELFIAWKTAIKRESAIGIVWNADKILHKLIRINSPLRLVILRPFLESRSLPGLARYAIKQVLILALQAFSITEVAKLSIPFDRAGKSSRHWVKDDFNTNLFEFDNGITEESTLMKTFDAKIGESEKLITVAGFLDLRKNPQVIYSTFQNLKAFFGVDIKLALIGKQSEDWKDVTSSWDKDGIVEIDEYVSTQELQHIMGRTNVMILPYSNRGASGVAINALTLGVPVVLSKNRNWTRASENLDGSLKLAKLNHLDISRTVNELLKLSREPRLKQLRGEPLQALSDFLLFGNSNYR